MSTPAFTLLPRAIALALSLAIAACATSKPPLSPTPDPERKKKRDSEHIEHGPYAFHCGVPATRERICEGTASST